MDLPNTAAKVATFLPEDLELLYAFWGSRHAAARTDPAALKAIPFEQQAVLYRQFRHYLDSDESPLGVYSDGRVGWDSIDPKAGSARVIGHFLRERFD